jgi:signal transduction histidine kinase/ActR/RegA family two-component response regulator
MVVAVYLVSGLVILGLLNALLSKYTILPAVEKEMLENERAMLSEQLHHAQKMESVGHLASSIAHDFNNMLTIIDGYSSLIVADPQSSETAENAQKVVDAARKASVVTRKLLSFGHKNRAEPVILDLNTALVDTDKMLSQLLGEKIELITKVASEPILVRADPIQVGQVLMNLAINARDAMPNGGRIVVQVSRKEMDGQKSIHPDLPTTGTYAWISVRDNGHGIESAHLSQIFEPFFTTREGGSGLGLAIVKSVVKRAGGVIDLSSKPEEGTVCSIYLPVVDAEESPAKKLPDAEVKASKNSDLSTILLVEDDEMIRTLIAKTLEAENYRILLAEDGWDAAKIARKYEGPIDLLFTDVAMLGMDGVELSLVVRELYPEIKLLFMSGYSTAQATEKGVPADAVFLEKPFLPNQVLAKVRQQLSE